MRPRHNILVRCLDREARRCHAFRLDVWGYAPVGQLNYRPARLRCILMDRPSLKAVRIEREAHPDTPIVVLTCLEEQIEVFRASGATRVLAMDCLRCDLHASLRTVLCSLTMLKTGPKPLPLPGAPDAPAVTFRRAA